jgi:hypothetical protein
MKTVMQFERSTHKHYGEIRIGKPKLTTRVFLIWPNCTWTDYVDLARKIRRDVKEEKVK